MLLTDGALYNFLQVGIHNSNIQFDRSILSCGPLVLSGAGGGMMPWEKILSHDYDAAKRFCFYFVY